MAEKIERTDAEWRAALTPEQYHVLRQKGTERAFTGEYAHSKDQGNYRCAGCGEAAFRADGTILAYTDGACIGNPGPGGWAALVASPEGVRELSGGAPETTNNRMELTAVIEALRAVPAEAGVRVVTDSQYVMNGITRWLAGWRKRGWRTATGSAVLNRDLWEALAALVGPRVSWE